MLKPTKSLTSDDAKTTPATRSKTPATRSKTTPATRSNTTPATRSNTTPPKSKTTPASVSTTTLHSPSQQLWEILSSCQIYDDLQQIIAQAELDALPQLPEVTFLTHKRTIDESAIGLIPEDQTASGLYPCNVYGDGNCLPRCASLLVYGHENNHLEMRARIIDELVRNEDNYLDNNFLSNGCNSSAHLDVAIQFAMFSEKYYAQKLSGVAVKRIFRAEVLDLCRSGRYMGAWQMAALANVLKTEVVSVYPMYGGKTMRNDLHRRFPPFRASELNKAKKVYIMWSNVNGANIPESDWRPNHFVPLLKTCPEENELSPVKSFTNEDEALSPMFEFEDANDEQDSIVNNSMWKIIFKELDDDNMPEIDDQATILADPITTDGHLSELHDQATTIADPITTDGHFPEKDDQATTITDPIATDRHFPEKDDQATTIADPITTDGHLSELHDQATTIADPITTDGHFPEKDDQATTITDPIATDRHFPEKDDQATTIADPITTDGHLPELLDQATTLADPITTDWHFPEKNDQATTIAGPITTDGHFPEKDDQDTTIAVQTSTDGEMPRSPLLTSVPCAMKYKVGDFLLSNCGIKACPCLVVQTPDDMESLPHAGVWVQYLKKARASLWTLEEKPFFLEYKHICKSLEPPSLTAAGTRIYYKLKL